MNAACRTHPHDATALKHRPGQPISCLVRAYHLPRGWLLKQSEAIDGAAVEPVTVRLKVARPRTAEATISPRLLTAKQAGIYLGFQTAWPVRELAWKGELPVVRIGKRRIAFDKQDLDSFIEQRKYRQSD